jgi:hypothetical protein
MREISSFFVLIDPLRIINTKNRVYSINRNINRWGKIPEQTLNFVGG